MNKDIELNQVKPLAFGRQAEIYDWGEGQVLKLFLSNWPDEANHEFEVSRLAFTQGARTPQPLKIIEKDGRPGIVFEKVDGPSLLRLLGERPWQVLPLARQFAELQHTVHRCIASGVPSAKSELEKAIRSKQQLTGTIQTVILERLSKLPDGDSLIHGDFHPDNVMVTEHGMVIIDWPNACGGCPLADVARTSIMLRFGEPVGKISVGLMILSRFLRGIFRTAYLREYFRQSSYSKKDLPSWELVLAAHRLGDNIQGEEPKLLRFINQNIHKI